MNSIESSIVKTCRHKDWADQIRECQSRPRGMTIEEWCSKNGITRADYYYRMKAVRKSCIDQVSQPIVPVPVSTLKTNTPSAETQQISVKNDACMSISAGSANILVAGNTPPELLRTLLEVTFNVK